MCAKALTSPAALLKTSPGVPPCLVCSCYGYSAEDVGLIIESMASQGKEATFCMGDDTPLPVLSARPHLLFNYFKQRFAQVWAQAIRSLMHSRAPCTRASLLRFGAPRLTSDLRV